MTDEELKVLAWTLLGEAAGDGVNGMTAVAHVIRNRSMSGRFPANPASTALQPSQFSTWNALDNGGNVPRARYPAGTASFNKAMRVVEKVFGDTPGKDPTQGATHYYAPKGMANQAAPYWWRGEAKRGEKRIGNHIFAIRREDAVAPTPASRGSVSPVGSFPSSGQMTVLRTGGSVKLPKIGATGGPSLHTAPTPAKQSLRLQTQREDAGASRREVSTVTLYDPVRGTEVKRLPSASDMVRRAQAPAKVVQRTAGFSTLSLSDRLEQADRDSMALLLNSSKRPQSFAGQDRGGATIKTTGGATQFGPDVRLPEFEPIPAVNATPDQIRRAKDYEDEVAASRARKAPIPFDPIQRPAVRVVTPPAPLQVQSQRREYYSTDTRSAPSPVQFQGTSSGRTYSAGQLYQSANGVVMAQADGSFKNTETGRSTPGSSTPSREGGHRSYNPDTGGWD